MDWEDKNYIQKGEFIGKVISVGNIFYTWIVFFLTELWGKVYLKPFSVLALLTFPTGYTLFYSQQAMGDSCIVSGFCMGTLFIMSSILAWVVFMYIGAFVGWIVGKRKPKEKDANSYASSESPYSFDWKKVK